MRMVLKTLDTIHWTDTQNTFSERNGALKTSHTQLGKNFMNSVVRSPRGAENISKLMMKSQSMQCSRNYDQNRWQNLLFFSNLSIFIFINLWKKYKMYIFQTWSFQPSLIAPSRPFNSMLCQFLFYATVDACMLMHTNCACACTHACALLVVIM